MPIELKQLGEQVGVLCCEFGTGDIQIIQTRDTPDTPKNAVLLRQHTEPHPIGESSDEFKGLTSDLIPEPKVLIRFGNVQSLDVMIESLQELKNSMTEKTTSSNN